MLRQNTSSTGCSHWRKVSKDREAEGSGGASLMLDLCASNTEAAVGPGATVYRKRSIPEFDILRKCVKVVPHAIFSPLESSQACIQMISSLQLTLVIQAQNGELVCGPSHLGFSSLTLCLNKLKLRIQLVNPSENGMGQWWLQIWTTLKILLYIYNVRILWYAKLSQ